MAVSAVRRIEEKARKKEAVSHQALFLSQFIRTLQDKSTNKSSNRNNVTQVKNNDVSSMFSRRKTHINRDLNEVQPLFIIISQRTSQDESTTVLKKKGERKKKAL